MFSKVRKKFIIVSICSIFIVLFCILGTINIVNYIGVVQVGDSAIAALKEGEGHFNAHPSQDISPEMPFYTRYFTVTLNYDGRVVRTDLNSIVSVTEDEAKSYAQDAFTAGSDSGFYGVYRYGVLEMRDGYRMYIFVDCSVGLDNFSNFLISSVVIGCAGVAVVFVLIFIFSGRIMKPVAESYKRQKQFITDAGHEIKTPLTIIGANTELVEMQSGQSEWTEGIKEQVARLSALTEKLVYLARMDEQTAISMFEFSLSDVVEESMKEFAVVAEAHKVVLKCDIQKGVLYTGNEEMIRRLVALLADNALKYTDGDYIKVSLKAVKNKNIIEMSNIASYMKDGDLDGLFERFVRGDASRNSETGGSGIGLSVARAIAEAHKGKIRGECRNGIVSFTVTL
ncbi:MAG TPA: HAMP domain-containing histidine kinase [Candidatus Coproplasma stercoripullorum]|uniref:histidine kinase n=1 Tax=Candidatus Coproplasma stercoripullorum TaxID=2840751 RepID=A0A9D1AH04_9FIRM|nr:HAMP domain-containing histidine kinase [Candidatus Coproplasma stercoripullorum]